MSSLMTQLFNPKSLPKVHLAALSSELGGGGHCYVLHIYKLFK